MLNTPDSTTFNGRFKEEDNILEIPRFTIKELKEKSQEYLPTWNSFPDEDKKRGSQVMSFLSWLFRNWYENKYPNKNLSFTFRKGNWEVKEIKKVGKPNKVK